MTPEDEKAIERAATERREAERVQAERDAAAAQPRCCSLYWSRHTRECPNRAYSEDGARWWRFWRWALKRVVGR